jgi:DNA-binding SARP family transcriptional activator
MEARVQLCGRIVIELCGRRVEAQLPGRQGELLFAYLALNRHRSVGRDELVEALWGERPPSGASSGLSALVSKLRRALGPGRLEGRGSLQLRLPAPSFVDLEAALEAIHRAEAALRREDWPEAWAAARVTLHVACRPFLGGEDAPWIEEVRTRLGDAYVRSLEATAESSLGIGGAELDTAERSARRLIREAPYRESGHRLLMEVLARRDNVAEALLVYEGLRQRLREELGAAPSGATRELHRRLLAAASPT